MTLLELPALVVDDVTAVVVSQPLVLINRDPAPNEDGVPLESALSLKIVDVEGGGIRSNTTFVYVNDRLAFRGWASPEIQPGFDGPRAGVWRTQDTLRIVLDPVVPFASQAAVEVRVAAATAGFGEVLTETYSFTAEDRTAPNVLAAQATAPKTVQVVFDEAMAVSDAVGFTFTALDAPAVPVQARAVEASGAAVCVTLDTDMTPDVRYRVVVAGATDVHGNAVLPPFDVAVFAGFRAARPADRRFDLWSMLPKHNRRDDTTGDLRKVVACLQEVLDLLLADVDRFPDLFDLERAPEAFLDAILADLGNPFAFELDALGKRRLASVLVEMYRQKGTAAGLCNAVRFFLGIDIEAITPSTFSTLILGESELGVDWELGPSDLFARYAFKCARPSNASRLRRTRTSRSMRQPRSRRWTRGRYASGSARAGYPTPERADYYAFVSMSSKTCLTEGSVSTHGPKRKLAQEPRQFSEGTRLRGSSGFDLHARADPLDQVQGRRRRLAQRLERHLRWARGPGARRARRR
jgi:phage tail-like protein